MKQKLCALTALILALSLLCGCANADLSWFTDRFKTRSQSAQSDDTQPDADKSDDEEPATTAIVTELPTEVKSFGLSYQEDYGLHPYNCESLNNRAIFSFIYEPLFAVTSDYRAEPILVDHWETDNDGFKTIIHLKSGILFHDGTPLTAQDAVWSILSARGSAYYGKRLYHVTAVEAADETTFVIVTNCAYECLPLLLDMPVTKMPPPEPEESEEADAEEAAPAEAASEEPPPYVPPVGTGPYYLDGTERLVRWARWWQHEKPLVDFDEITLCHTTTTANIRDNFEYSNINLVLTDPNSAAYAGFHNDNELWECATPVMQYIGYNLTSSVFSNYGLRGAITYAIDRKTIVADELDGFATEAVLPCLPQSPYYDTRLALDYDYDLEKCKSRLADADIRDMDEDGILDVYVPSLGYAVPASGTMIVCSSGLSRVQTATDLVNTLNDLGFDITLQTLDYGDYQYALSHGVYDLYFGEVRLSPNFDLTPFFSPSGALNYGAMTDATMLNLCDLMLVNSGNSYNLYQRICERGYLTPVLFKSYGIYTTRGSVPAPNGYWDWFLPKKTEE